MTYIDEDSYKILKILYEVFPRKISLEELVKLSKLDQSKVVAITDNLSSPLRKVTDNKEKITGFKFNKLSKYLKDTNFK